MRPRAAVRAPRWSPGRARARRDAVRQWPAQVTSRTGRERTRARQRDRVAIRLSLGGHLRPDHAAGAVAVLDHDGLAEETGHLLRHHARNGIDGPPGWERHDETDRFRWIILRDSKAT